MRKRWLNKTNITNPYYRDINDYSIERFVTLVSAIHWNDIYNEPNPSKSYDKFIEKIKEAYEDAFPFRKAKRHKKSRKPWITVTLLKRINERNKLYDTFIKTKDLDILAEYKKRRNKLNSDIKKAKVNYYKNKFITIQHNPVKVWKTAKELMSKSSSTIPNGIE